MVVCLTPRVMLFSGISESVWEAYRYLFEVSRATSVEVEENPRRKHSRKSFWLDVT